MALTCYLSRSCRFSGACVKCYGVEIGLGWKRLSVRSRSRFWLQRGCRSNEKQQRHKGKMRYDFTSSDHKTGCIAFTLTRLKVVWKIKRNDIVVSVAMRNGNIMLI